MRVVVLCVLALLFVGCSPTNLDKVTEISRDADHLGKISKVSENKVLLNELNNDPSPLWISITAETKIFNSEGNAASFKEFKKGIFIEVWNDGGVFLSDPRQTTATRVIIK